MTYFCVGKYKWAALLAPVTIILEVILEMRIPLHISDIVDTGINGMRESRMLQVSAKNGANGSPTHNLRHFNGKVYGRCGCGLCLSCPKHAVL